MCIMYIVGLREYSDTLLGRAFEKLSYCGLNICSAGLGWGEALWSFHAPIGVLWALRKEEPSYSAF